MFCSTLKYHFDRTECPEIGQSFYIGIFQVTANNEQEALDFYQEVNSECKKANMPLQSWNINSNSAMNTICQNYADYTIPHQQTVLGLR